MVRYMKCPRCELNYIDAEKQEYCDICLKEMKGIPTDFDDFDDDTEEVATELCPICGENMMNVGEKMCDECKKRLDDTEEEPDPEQDTEWRNYLDDDTEDEPVEGEVDLSSEYGDEFEDEEEEDDQYHGESDDDDYDYVTGDEIYEIEDDEEDEESDEEEDF